MEFTQLTTTKMGTMAENMFGPEFIISKGYVPYSPYVDMSHPIDFIAREGAKEWEVDVKAKSSMKYKPFTGIDLKDYENYLTYKNPVYLLFADPKRGEVYGQWLSLLHGQPNHIYGDVVVWPLSGMTHYRWMSQMEIDALKELENSNY